MGDNLRKARAVYDALPEDKKREWRVKGGLKGGAVARKYLMSLTKKERSERARQAANARWQKVKEEKS